jgi:hypothetical protein
MKCTPLVEMDGLIDIIDKKLYIEGEGCGGINTYGISMFSYHGVYIGIQWFFRITDFKGFWNCHGGPMDGRLLFSRDPKKQWQIPTREFVIPCGKKGEWDWGMICGIGNRPVLSPKGDEWWYYYGGWEYGHGISNRRACMGLAKFRVDGFASLTSVDTMGVMETPLITFTGSKLLLNINATGKDTTGAQNYVKAELADENGKPFKGFSMKSCDLINSDKVNQTVTWKGKHDVSKLAGKPVKVKIEMKGAELYAFQFTK